MQNFNIVSEVELFYKSKIKAIDRCKINCSKDAYICFKSINHFNANVDYKECFYTMYLNRAMKVLSIAKTSEGSTTETAVDIKFILQGAILQNASAIIISHNHPSGNLTPSKKDILMTNKIKAACKLMDIRLIEHLILTTDGYYSFADSGMI